MLIPLPEADLNESPLVRGADILAFLEKEGESVVEEVMLDFLKRHPKADASEFMDSLSLLYTLGAIDYDRFRIRRRTS